MKELTVYAPFLGILSLVIAWLIYIYVKKQPNGTELMQELGVNACTDITGFGLLGHACQLAGSSRVGIRFYSSSIPFFPEAVGFAEMGLCPGGLFRNREFYSESVTLAPEVTGRIQDILFDPQTSGGLLISVGAGKAQQLLDGLHGAGVSEAVIIGEVFGEPAGRVLVV